MVLHLYALICFLAESKRNGSISVSCLCVKYEARARRRLAWVTIKTGNRRKASLSHFKLNNSRVGQTGKPWFHQN